MRTQQQGFTVLELMVGVVIVGVLAAVALPQFTAAAAKSKSAEAKLELEKLAHNAALYFGEHRRFPQGTATVLPGGDGEACNEANRAFGVSTAWRTDAVWSALDFSIEERSRFSYHFEATAKKSARAWAVADIKCSGEHVVYEVVLEGRATGRVEWVMIEPGMADNVVLPAVEADGEDFDTAAADAAAEEDDDEIEVGMGLPGDGSGTETGTGTGSGTETGTGTGTGTVGDTGTGGDSGTGADTGTGGDTGAGGDTGTGSGADTGSTGGGNGGGNGGGGSGGGGNGGGGSTCGGGGGGTAIITCPTGYELHLATCTCKKSK